MQADMMQADIPQNDDLFAPPPLGPELTCGKWKVHVIDSHGNITDENISGKQVWTMQNRRVVVDFNRRGQPIKDSGDLFGLWLGSFIYDLNIIPINYNDWRKVPHYRKEMAWKLPGETSSNDAIAQVFGPEPSRRVRFIGHGPMQSKCFASSDSCNVEMKSKMNSLEEKIDIVASALKALIKSRDIQFQESGNGGNVKIGTALKVLIELCKDIQFQGNENSGNNKLASVIQALMESCRVNEDGGNMKFNKIFHQASTSTSSSDKGSITEATT